MPKAYKRVDVMLNPISISDVMNSLVPISRFNKGEANKIFEEVRKTGFKIVLKNNTPTCVLLTPETYELMLETIEDYRLLDEAEKRMANAKAGDFISSEKAMRELGISEADLDDTNVEQQRGGTMMANDKALREKVQRILREDKDLRGYGLNADVVAGEVQLQGIVDTLQEKERAGKLVGRVPGVKSVANAVSISTDGAIQDEDVTMEAAEELDLDPRVNLRHIGVASVDGHGTVVLKGRTGDPAELEAAREAAAKARGVTRVVSQVKVGEEEMSLKDIFHSQVNNDREE